MARIDLKNALIRIIDGYSNTAAVNGSPASGNTTLGVDTFGATGITPIGTMFNIAGSVRRYFVTAYNANESQIITVDATSGNFTLGFEGTVDNPIMTQTTASIAEGATAAAVQTALEALAAIVPGDVLVTGSTGGPFTVEFKGNYANTNIKPLVSTNVDLAGGGTTVITTVPVQGGTPHSLSFTPALLTGDGVPVDDAVITFLGRTLEVNIGSGNLTYSEKRNMDYELDRGLLDTVKEGDEAPVEVAMDFIWDFLTAISGVDTPTVEDALKQRGPAATWISSATDDPCAPYAVDLEVEYIPPCGGIQREIITLPDFRWESLDHNFTDASVATQGKCNATQAIVARAA